MITDNYTISVAMATYNGEKYLREQLDSLYAQTRVPDEVVVCDDNSTDSTVQILEEFKNKKGLKYFVNEKSLGVSRNFERAIHACTGDYIAICDQDDVWMPHKIKTLVTKLREIEDESPACVSSKSTAVDQSLNPITYKNNIYKDSAGIKETILESHNAQGCTMMMNRKLAEKMKPFPAKKLVYDAYISLLAASIGEKYNIGEALMYYRYHQNNVVAQRKNKKQVGKRIIEHLRMWKHSALFEHGRFSILRFIYSNHKDEIKLEALTLIEKLLEYQSGNIFKKLNYIWKEQYYSLNDKVRKSVWLLSTAVLPLSTKDKSF